MDFPQKNKRIKPVSGKISSEFSRRCFCFANPFRKPKKMIIFDTSVWIEFLKGNSKYFQTAVKLLEDQKVLAVECIFAELLQGAKNKRERGIITQYWENLPKVSHDGLWVEAGIYSSENRFLSQGVGIIDTVILLAGRKNDAQIWSLDKKLNSILSEKEIYAV